MTRENMKSNFTEQPVTKLFYITTHYKYIKGLGVFPVGSSECSFCDYGAKYRDVNGKYYCYGCAEKSGVELE